MGKVSASDPQGTSILLTVHSTQGVVPPSNLLDVTASHMTDTGEPKIATRQVGLSGLPCAPGSLVQSHTTWIQGSPGQPPSWQVGLSLNVCCASGT